MLKVKQANDRYLFDHTQQEELLLYELQQVIEHNKAIVNKLQDVYETHNYSNNGADIKYILSGAYKGKDLYGPLERYIEFKMKPDALYFMFGKYKGRIVQDVLTEDIDYCKWFSENVCGRDFNTLKILDLIHKTLLEKPYIDKNKKEIIYEVIHKHIPIKWIPYVQEHIFLPQTTNSACYNVADDEYEHWINEVGGYEDIW